ncbi:MAG TPA: hypothetical protein VFD92_00465 [Candidatus Binatia bacterium]|nr:hypothetical protein [Candidatus Binatia bacterium]
MTRRRATLTLRANARRLAAVRLLAALAAAPLAPWTAAVPAAWASELAPDAVLQARIARVARAASEDDVAAALDELRRSSAPDFSDLVPQLAVFLVSARGEREGMAPAVVVSRLGISRAQILRGVAPYLDTSDDRLRRQLANLLGAVDEGPDGTVDFGEYRAYLAERGGSAPTALVEHLFERSPAKAARILAETSGSDASARAAALAQVDAVESARAALGSRRAGGSADASDRAAAGVDALAGRPEWWARAYAAALVRADRRAAARDVRDRLANDPDDRVRAVLGGRPES